MNQRDAPDEPLMRDGFELIRQLFALLRIARTHGVNNAAWGPGLTSIRQVVTGHGGVTLKIVDNVPYMDETRIRVERDGLATQMGLADAFRHHHVGAITLDADYRDDALKALLVGWGVSDPAQPEEGFAALEALLEGGIGLTPSLTREVAEGQQARHNAKVIYATTLTAVTEVMDSVKISQTLPLKRAKRVMHRMVDNLLADDSNLMGLTTLRCYDEYTYHHSVNVCVLALSLGRRMGLPRHQLSQLGMSSLFHDIGKRRIPVEVLNKPGEFSEREWQLIRQHPVDGVKDLVKMKGADELAARVVTGSFEHHMGHDHSGYPKLPRPRVMSLYGRIISLCDCYDAMTSSRVYNRTAISPEKALKFMLNKSGKAFDPVLIKVFVNTIGIFPVGTLLLLDSDEMAVVTAAHPDPALGDRPVVRLISDRHGHALIDTEDVSLDEKAPGAKAYTRNIRRILDPDALGIDVSRYFL